MSLWKQRHADAALYKVGSHQYFWPRADLIGGMNPPAEVRIFKQIVKGR